MNPTPGDVYVSVPLTNLSVAYALQTNEFIADRVFPNVPVQIQGGTFWKYRREDWNRTDVEKRAPATESKGTGFDMSSDTYFAHVYAIHKDIDDQTRANAAGGIVNLDRDSTNLVTRQLLLKRDQIWFDTFFKTGVWGTDRAGVAAGPTGDQFLRFDVAGSDPIKVLRASIINQTEETGMRPNTLVLGARVWQVLADHEILLDRIKATQGPQMPTEQLLAQLVGIERVLVGYGIFNTAVEGAEEANSFQMNPKAMLLTYAAPNAGPLSISAGYTFSWTGYLNAGALGNRIKRFRMEQIASDRVEGEMSFDMKVVAPDLGTFFSDVVA